MSFKKVLTTFSAAALLFTVPVTISAKAEGLSFKDVPKDADYYPFVQKLTKFKILGGYEDNTFKPTQYVTRAQAASILAKVLELDLTNVKDPGFSDVSKENSHYAAIAKLTEMGVFSKQEKFNPNNPLTRAQMAAILVPAFNLKSDEIKTYPDVKKDDWHYHVVGTFGALNITAVEGNYNPNGYVKRANLAAFIVRLINLKRDDDKQDIWDQWKDWDNRGIIQFPGKPDKDEETPIDSPKPPKDTDDEQELKELEKAIDSAVDDLEDTQEEVEDVLEDLREAEDDNDKEEIEEEKENLSKVLNELDKLIIKAEDLLEKAKKADYKELESDERALERAIRDAKKVVDETYGKTFDKEYYEELLEETIEDIEEAIKDAERAIKDNSNSINSLNRAYEDLTKMIESAEKLLDSYDDSNVDTLQDEEEELLDLIDEAESVLKELIDKFEDKLDNQVDYFEDSLKAAMDELDDAIDEDNRGDIYDAREKLEGILENAENLLKQYRNVNIDKLQDEKESLEKAIKKAKDELEDSK
ncbi:hypothetical protein CD30_03075 [Ureibacillus massiliensis 4400831 = CIP 108448 = CCUG 49529]|uniref:SLH domain-containing protein n=1 Tax=Ureibacillus massiliensis 4400831 = CIP 108448 = CCUG 49529 TaxID=1211035 RepID=A0A0A3JY32_9BACL|nr:S-layer homology domain-containing protein [Ureibacillus massiliensis]KGR91902.1 hypothetical protein CD30_03075 [Ureibacillus massiliensis 4400831 = CIP 108448 = CCUG 49529]